jgi:hypothetical protein
MKLKLAFALVLFTAVAPGFAESHPHTISAHMRTQTFHDRSPHIHERAPQPRHEA